MKKIVVLLLISLLLIGCNGKNSSKGIEKETSDSKKYTIGIIKYVDHISLDAAKNGFIEELKKNDVDVEIIEKSANGDMSLTTTLAQEMLSKKVDLIYAIATPAAQATKNVVRDIPVVFSAVTDPVGAGIVNSIESPDANITGVSDYVNPKMQIEEFLKIYPNIKTFGVIYNTSEQNSQVQVEKLESVLKEKNIFLVKVGINTVNDIPASIAFMSNNIDALFAITDNTVASAVPILSEQLLKNNIPSLSSEEGQVKSGLLMSEGINYESQGAQAAKIAIRILNGEDIKNIPVEYNEINHKVVNEKTAKALKLDLNNEIFKDAQIIK
ncbi:ABC transporter substrate-binding protein [Peptoniphilus mikwangii]|uniref:ABC transporter substrate-binding protein n=1 Tax=Peptoniphilus mikwangii TaxID=1354300 RepID=UPI000424CE41|nr:ABC transporter substrate-binding protein [Peptoniphilus mikwangii]